MFKVIGYKTDKQPGNSFIERTGDFGIYNTAAEARSEAEALVKSHDHHGYNGEKDYFWGRNDRSNEVIIYSIQPDPLDLIMNI